MLDTQTLDSLSLVAVYSAMGVYAIAFIVYTIDLARRVAPAPVREAALVGGGSTALADPEVQVPASGTGTRLTRVAVGLTVLGWLLHLAGTVLRGFAAERVPWANMYEFTLTSSAIIIGVFLVVQFWQDLRFLGVFVVGLVVVALGVATINFYVDVVPLAPPLQSIWLVIHVFVASLGTGFFALGAALSLVQLLKGRHEASSLQSWRFLASVPSAERLETIAYRLIVIGFVFWTFTLIAGAIWAERAWGRYWGWDTKEVWTFIIWTLYAGYIHARATRGWRGARSAWLSIVGFLAVVFNFTVVNLFFKGWHAYSGL